MDISGSCTQHMGPSTQFYSEKKKRLSNFAQTFTLKPSPFTESMLISIFHSTLICVCLRFLFFILSMQIMKVYYQMSTRVHKHNTLIIIIIHVNIHDLYNVCTL